MMGRRAFYAGLCLLVAAQGAAAFDIYEYAKCQLCETAKPTGAIDDCCCNVEDVDQANTRHFLPILHDLTKRTYFRYFKVDLWRDCPFWPEDGECAKEECAVCECDQNEVPACWREEEAKGGPPTPSKLAGNVDEDNDARVAQLSRVDYDGNSGSQPDFSLEDGAAVSTGAKAGTEGMSPAPGYDEGNVWSVQGAAPYSAAQSYYGHSGAGAQTKAAPSPAREEESLQYVNLLRNPEGYTGYSGPKATRIWKAVYGENCFSGPLDGMCLEERVFYRLISGLQTSINTHIAMTYGEGEGSHGWDIYTEREQQQGAGLAAARAVLGRLYTQILDWTSKARGQGPFPAVPEAYAPGNGNGNGNGGAASASSAAGGSSVPGKTGSSSGRDTRGRGPSSSSDPLSLPRLILSPGLKPNMTLYHERIAAYPERLQNLYFAFLFLVRAVAKAQPLLESMDFATGNATADADTRAAVRRLLDVEVPSVLAGFDESKMFQVTTHEFLGGGGGKGGGGGGADSGTCPPVLHGLGDVHELQHRYLALVERKAALREAFRDKYRNISRILDCVGCEKCRLWGKLQFLGLGTAMKILFADADATTIANKGPYAAAEAAAAAAATAGGAGGMAVHLSRNELVALINVLHRLSMSLAAMHVMRDLEAQEKLAALLWKGGAGLGLVAVLLLLAVRLCRGRDKPKQA